MHHRRAALFVVTAALGLGLTACSGSTSGTGATPAATASTATSPAATPARSYAHLSAQQINDVLLTYTDMPPGYAEAPDSASAQDHTFCNYTQPTKAVVRGTRSFNKGGGLSQQFVSVTIREYATPAAARKAWDAMKQALDTCHRETYQGEKVTYSRMSAPTVGDASAGVRMTVSDRTVGEMTLVEDFALVGPAVVSSGAGGVMNVDADQAAQVLKQQVAAYKDAALT